MKFSILLDSLVMNIIGGDLYDHSMSSRIFTKEATCKHNTKDHLINTNAKCTQQQWRPFKNEISPKNIEIQQNIPNCAQWSLKCIHHHGPPFQRNGNPYLPQWQPYPLLPLLIPQPRPHVPENTPFSTNIQPNNTHCTQQPPQENKIHTRAPVELSPNNHPR